MIGISCIKLSLEPGATARVLAGSGRHASSASAETFHRVRGFWLAANGHSVVPWGTALLGCSDNTHQHKLSTEPIISWFGCSGWQRRRASSASAASDFSPCAGPRRASSASAGLMVLESWMAATARIVCISCLTLFPLSGGTACVVRISLFWLAATWMATTARIISISCIILSTMQGVTARIISISWLGGFGWQRRHASSELAASDFHIARGHGAHHQHQLVRFHAMARIISIQTLHILPGAASGIPLCQWPQHASSHQLVGFSVGSAAAQLGQGAHHRISWFSFMYAAASA